MFNHILIGKSAPKIVNAIVEIPKNTHNKYEYDEKLGVIKLDRVLHSPFHYPFDYGFIPETRSPDGDHLDVLIITDSPVFPGCLLEVKVIGAMLMSDDKGMDEKILAVPVGNPIYKHYKNLSHVSPHLLREIEHFFSDYKFLEDKEPSSIKGWVDRTEAYKIIKEAQATYHGEILKLKG
ncbi:MAG: inorganic diphosphatase [Candidatus Shapirobacteria bacterium]